MSIHNIIMFFYLKVSAKDRKILRNFIKFISKQNSSLITVKNFPRKKKRKFITVLNSPHVNKTAQEQFEFRFYNQCFLVSSIKPFSFFSLLKKVKNQSFPGIKLEIQGLLNNKGYNKKILKLMNPDSVISYAKSESCFRKIKDSSGFKIPMRNYIQLFDCYGEVCLKNSFYLSE